MEIDITLGSSSVIPICASNLLTEGGGRYDCSETLPNVCFEGITKNI